jgi:hypothetical protein
MRFEVLTVIMVSMSVFWFVTLCGLVDRDTNVQVYTT